MTKVVYFLVMLPVVFTFGCASNSDFQQLRHEFEQLGNDTRNQYNGLQKDMSLFEKAYNPELQKSFSENVVAAENYRESIEKIRHDIENTSGKISTLLRESENDRMSIAKNLKSAEVENIVNEFSHLKNEWRNTVKNLEEAAISAEKKVGAAQHSANLVVEFQKSIDKRINELVTIQKQLQADIKRIDSRLK